MHLSAVSLPLSLICHLLYIIHYSSTVSVLLADFSSLVLCTHHPPSHLLSYYICSSLCPLYIPIIKSTYLPTYRCKGKLDHHVCRVGSGGPSPPSSLFPSSCYSILLLPLAPLLFLLPPLLPLPCPFVSSWSPVLSLS